jgi:glycosyltransferase involved in cell wall biosynthesis
MHIIVDGVIYGRQKYGGINTYFNYILPRLALREDTSVHLLLPRTCIGTAPGPPVRHVRRDLIPTRTGLSWRLDNRLDPALAWLNLAGVALWAKTKPRALFQSTYFTSLPSTIPQVATALDLNHELFPEAYSDTFGLWLRRRYPRYLRRATRIIAVSHATRDDIVRFYGINRSLIDVVYPGLDCQTFFPDRDPEHLETLRRTFGLAPPYVLYVGNRSTGFKNFSTVLRAFACDTNLAGLTVAVAGPAWLPEELSQVDRVSSASRLRLIVNPDDQTLRQLYSFAAAFVYPSLNEGFGIPLLEAMACGAPVIASDTPVFREVADDAAMYFDPHDSDALARSMQRCLNKATRDDLVARGLRRVLGFSWETSAADTYAVYRRALA